MLGCGRRSRTLRNMFALVFWRVIDYLFCFNVFLLLYFRSSNKALKAVYVKAELLGTMVNFPTVSVPAYKFQFNLVVYSLPATARKTVSLRLKI